MCLLCLMIVIIATCNTRKNTISVDILQGDIILKDWICWPFWLGGGVTCVPSCWTDFGSSLSHCLDFSGALYGVEELRTWNWKLWRLVLSRLVWPGCAWGAFCLVRVAGYCQAQPKLQVKFSLKAELALVSDNPATPTPTPTHPHPWKFNLKLIGTQ